jgi:hypothetical protein
MIGNTHTSGVHKSNEDTNPTPMFKGHTKEHKPHGCHKKVAQVKVKTEVLKHMHFNKYTIKLKKKSWNI